MPSCGSVGRGVFLLCWTAGRDEALIRVMLETGMRANGAFSRQVDDVNLDGVSSLFDAALPTPGLSTGSALPATPTTPRVIERGGTWTGVRAT